jgi:uncharacterized damage-inducible protein DinB
MKHVIRRSLLAVSAVAILSSAAAAQTATIHGDLTKDWNDMKGMMTAIANAMPDDKIGFKPTPAQRSYGEHILHIAQVNMMLIQTLGGKTAAPQINMQAKTKADMVKAMNDSFDYGAAVIKEFDNTSIQGTINAAFMGPSTRARIMFFLLGHTWDTYGQMAVYLRLNNVVPPASRRP